MYCSVCPYLSESTQMYSFAQIVLDSLIIPIHAVLKEITGNLLLLFKFIIKNKKHKHKIHNTQAQNSQLRLLHKVQGDMGINSQEVYFSIQNHGIFHQLCAQINLRNYFVLFRISPTTSGDWLSFY